MDLVPGKDTIRGLAGEPPPEIKLCEKLMRQQNLLTQLWNSSFVAIIPYCFKCKVALDWHVPPDDGEVFTCPSCGRVWVLDKEDQHGVRTQPTAK